VASQSDLLRIAAAAPDAAVLVDEAYFEFYGATLVGQLGRSPNLFVARTFSKAYGLAGMRIGVLAGDAVQMAVVRRTTSPYNVNAVALACVMEALSDQDHVTSYVEQVRQNRAELQETLRELGLEYWPSQANFVLVRVGAQHREFVARMRERGILVRDRSTDPGCPGCVRITVGTKREMEPLTAALRDLVPKGTRRVETNV
jgi:histidinol-phosphate aminotransferase